MHNAIKRGYVVVVIGPLLTGVDNLCFIRTWPPEDSWETAEVGPFACLKSCLMQLHAFRRWGDSLKVGGFSKPSCLSLAVLTPASCQSLYGSLTSTQVGGSWLACAYQVHITDLY